MFTGLIKETGTVYGLKRSTGKIKYNINCNTLLKEIKEGSSIAVNGVCQTVTALNDKGFETEALHGTIEKTTLANLINGQGVNLEPSLKLGDPIDGHFVQGHVSGTGIISIIKANGGSILLTINSKGWKGEVKEEGSVALDGISLTVYRVDNDSFTVNIIPETWKRTILSGKGIGQKVNLEEDRITSAFQNRYINNQYKKQNIERKINSEILQEWGY